MARHISRQHTLTNYTRLDLYRSIGSGDYSDKTGEWVPSPRVKKQIKANVQPMKHSQTLLMQESERTKEWINIRTQDEIRKASEGSDGNDADVVIYCGKQFKVMGVSAYRMGVLDHYHAIAAFDGKTAIGDY